MPQSILLEKSGALVVNGLTLQLKVRHVCGTCHAYVVRFDVTDENGIESQLSQDLTHLIELMRERANYGEYSVNDRTYFAIEIPDTNDAVTRMLSDDMPVIVLPGQVERESQSVEEVQEAERDPTAAQSVRTPTQDDVQNPEQSQLPIDHVSEEESQPPSLKESNEQLESEEPKAEEPKAEQPAPEAQQLEEQSNEETKSDVSHAAEEHKLAAEEHDLASKEHKLAEEDKREESDDKLDLFALNSPPAARRGRGRKR